jgi:CRISPR/Cas system-associated exonuclease Cas4 (RecB family)
LKPINLRKDPLWRIYAGLVEEAEDYVRHYKIPTRRFRASEIANCRRQIWYRLGGYIPFPKKPWLEMVGAAGDMGHDYVRYLANHYQFGLYGVEFEADHKQREMDNQACEYSVDGTKVTLSCRPDGFIKLGKRDAVLEIKTMTTFKFEKLQRAWKKGGNEGAIEWCLMEKPQFIWQGNQTSMIMEKNHVYLLCIDRNLNRIGLSTDGFGKPHTWEPLAGERTGGAVWEVEESDRQNILHKAADITHALRAGEPPAPEYVSSSTECSQCDFWIYCHGKKLGAEYPLKGLL